MNPPEPGQQVHVRGGAYLVQDVAHTPAETQPDGGSANITKAAMERNMELGVLITGGDEPGDVVDHFLNLIREGILLLKTVDLDG